MVRLGLAVPSRTHDQEGKPMSEAGDDDLKGHRVIGLLGTLNASRG